MHSALQGIFLHQIFSSEFYQNTITVECLNLCGQITLEGKRTKVARISNNQVFFQLLHLSVEAAPVAPLLCTFLLNLSLHPSSPIRCTAHPVQHMGVISKTATKSYLNNFPLVCTSPFVCVCLSVRHVFVCVACFFSSLTYFSFIVGLI